jgi:hypothetical protein
MWPWIAFLGGRALGKGDPFWRQPSESSADWTSYGEPCPRQASLSDVRVIMTFMHVLKVESLCQAAMGQIPALECLLSGARGCTMVVFGSFAQDRRPSVMLPRVLGVFEPG